MKPVNDRKLFSTIGAAVAAAIICTMQLAPAAAQDVKPLVRAISSDVNSLDPHDTRGVVDQEVGLNIYDKLVEMEFKENPDGTLVGDPMNVVPNLAESWTVDGPKITFKLRKDVKFYPTGNPMTADDVVYSFSRLTAFPGNGKNQAGVAGIFTADQIKKIDDYTVEVTHMDGPGGKPAEVVVRLTSFKFQQFGIVDSGRSEEARNDRRSVGARLAAEESGHHRAVLHRRPHPEPADHIEGGTEPHMGTPA